MNDSSINSKNTQSMQVFDSPEFGKVRTCIEPDGTVLCCATDVATALGYVNPAKAVMDHCRHKDGFPKRYPIVDLLGRTQHAKFITKPDVLRLITRSKLPAAQKFEAWMFEEVMPSVIDNGGYIAGQGQMDDLELMARAILLSQKLIESKQAIIDHMAPMAAFANSVADSNTLILIRDMAKVLKQHGVNTGGTRFFEQLRADGYLEKNRNEPTQRSLDLGILRIVEGSAKKPSGSVIITRTTKVTGKGQVYFVNRYANQKAMAV